MLMTTHMMAPAFDSELVTGSTRIINDLIRKNLHFDGPVITDDLTMSGASSLGEIGERSVRAFKAGHDLLLFGSDYESAMVAYDYLVNAFESGEVLQERLANAIQRVAGLKFKLGGSLLRP